MSAISPDSPNFGVNNVPASGSRLPDISQPSTSSSSVSISKAPQGVPIGISSYAPQLDLPKVYINSWVPIMLGTINFNALQRLLGLLADAQLASNFSQILLSFHSYYDMGAIMTQFYSAVDTTIDQNIQTQAENDQIAANNQANIDYNNNVVIPHNQAVDAYNACMAAPPPEGCGTDPGPYMDLLPEETGTPGPILDLPDINTFQGTQAPVGTYDFYAQETGLAALSAMLQDYFRNSNPDLINSDHVLDDSKGIGNEKFKGLFLNLSRSIKSNTDSIGDDTGGATLSMTYSTTLGNDITGVVDLILFNEFIKKFGESIVQRRVEGELAGASETDDVKEGRLQEAATTGNQQQQQNGQGQAQGAAFGTVPSPQAPPPPSSSLDSSTESTESTATQVSTTVESTNVPLSADFVAESAARTEFSNDRDEASSLFKDFLNQQSISRDIISSDLKASVQTSFDLATLLVTADIQENRIGQSISEDEIESELIKAAVNNFIALVQGKSLDTAAEIRTGQILPNSSEGVKEQFQQNYKLTLSGVVIQLADQLLTYAGLRAPTDTQIGDQQRDVRDLGIKVIKELDDKSLDRIVESFSRSQEMYTSVSHYLEELLQPYRMNVLNLQSAFLPKPEGYYSDNPV